EQVALRVGSPRRWRLSAKPPAAGGTDVVCRTDPAYNPGSPNQEGSIVPELPEVETVVRDLRPHLTGATIVAVEAGSKPLRRPWRSEWNAFLIHQRIERIDRRGKWIVL